MTSHADNQTSAAPKGVMQRLLDVVERVGNKVPHPVVLFLGLIVVVIVLAHVLQMAGVSVTTEVIVPNPEKVEAAAGFAVSDYDTGTQVKYATIDEKNYTIETRTIAARSLLTIEGLRFIYSSLIPNFMGFTALGLIVAAMIGVGVAEEAGLVATLIRKLVLISPRWAMVYLLALLGILSSIAADAGYLVLIPLAGAAFVSLRRHPLAGLALGFASVAAAFTVNILIKPLDAILVEFTNDAIHMVDPSKSIGLASNLWFSIASVVMLTFIVALITERVIEPRLGEYKGEKADEESGALSADESRGLRYAGLGFLAVLIVFGLLSIPEGAPLRNPDTGELIGNSPLMNGLIGVIMVLFLVTGAAYGYGARTMNSITDIVKSMEKAMANLGGLVLLFFVLSQFIAYFNYSNIGTVTALGLADTLKASGIGPFWLLIGFIVVVVLIDIVIVGAVPKWAIFAPIFVPLLVTLKVDPEAVLAAYRVADSPMNALTPVNAYFALIVSFAQKYDKNAGVGTIVALLLPYVSIMLILWTCLFAAWFLLGLPWGL